LELVKEMYVVKETANFFEDDESIIAAAASDNIISSSCGAVLP
jgi:hypothetical protein